MPDSLYCRTQLQHLSGRLWLLPVWTALFLITSASPSDPLISRGDVFVSLDGGKVAQYSPDGTLRRTLDTPHRGELTGSAFDSKGNFYVTGFNSGNLMKFGPDLKYVGVFGSGYENYPESAVLDAAGNFFVGAAQNGGPRAVIKKLDTSGAPLETYEVDREDRGSDWIDLAADQTTIFYTSEGEQIKRYDTRAKTQLPDFGDDHSGKKYALRILADGGVLVANSHNVLRFDKAGKLIKTYLPHQDVLFALNLDPDGKSFWTAEISQGDFFRVDIDSGNVITTIHTGQHIGGLSVYGELTASVSTPPPPPPPPVPPPGNLISFGNPVPCVFGVLTSHKDGHSMLDLSSANITGNEGLDLTLRSRFHVPGTTLEIDTGSGWKTVGNDPIRVHGGMPLRWPVRLRVDDCPGSFSESDRPEIEVTALSPSGSAQQLNVPVQAQITPDSWLHCWRGVLEGVAGLLVGFFIFYGFWVPARFGPRVGVMLSPEEDIEQEGFFYLIRAQRGSGSGFYRSAAVYVGTDFRVSGKAGNAVARLQAAGGGNQVSIRPVASLWRRGADGEWEAVHEETLMRTGVLFRNDSRSLYFELRTK